MGMRSDLLAIVWAALNTEQLKVGQNVFGKQVDVADANFLDGANTLRKGPVVQLLHVSKLTE